MTTPHDLGAEGGSAPISSEELRACPFCGTRATLIPDPAHSTAFQCGCSDPDCPASLLIWEQTGVAAILAWNRRASDTASQRIAELEAELKRAQASDRAGLKARFEAAMAAEGIALEIGSREFYVLESAFNGRVADMQRERADAAQSEASRWKAEAEGARGRLAEAVKVIEGLVCGLPEMLEWGDLKDEEGLIPEAEAFLAFLSQHSEGEK